MRLIKTKIPGPLIIKTDVYKDKRGFLKETFRNNFFTNIKFPFDIMSFSKKKVLRGLHIQTNNCQAKIITVTHGKIFDVVVDLRKNSKTFGKYVSLILSQSSNFSFYVPKGFAHGFLCLSDKCTVYYKCSEFRDPQSEKTLSWNDNKVNIKWPISNPILSKKDRNGLSLTHF